MKNKTINITALSVLLSLPPCTAAAQQQYSEYLQAVDEYVPAPGQFVNVYPAFEDGDNAASMARKCTESIAGEKGGLVSLGGFGGYITFHFDHSIANVAGRKDLLIEGNAMRDLISEEYHDKGGSSEPGIVMVSRDDNGNGLPDDKWYELRGSADEDAPGRVIHNYEITYRYQAMSDIPWTDNQGGSGTVNRNSFHKQEYYPMWLTGSDLTFSGTRLPDNAVEVGGDSPHWVQLFFRYGYVDNLPNSDTDGCSFDLDWAVDENRQPVHLDGIDFVRVYTAMNQRCEPTSIVAHNLGETSTEVTRAKDLHLAESVDYTTGIGTAPSGGKTPREVSRFTADGRRVSGRQPGLNIIKMSDGSVRKVAER